VVYTQKQKEILNQVEQTKQELQGEIQIHSSDKVRVEEVQDALRRLTDSISQRIDYVSAEWGRRLSDKSEDLQVQIKGVREEISEISGTAQGRVS